MGFGCSFFFFFLGGGGVGGDIKEGEAASSIEYTNCLGNVIYPINLV